MDPSAFPAGLIIILASSAIAIAGLLAVGRWLPQARRKEDEGVKAVFFSMVGVLYALLLAFVVVVVWEDFVDAEDNSIAEVSRIHNLARDADAFPRSEQVRIRGRLVTYARAVAGPEWTAMAKGRSSPVAQRAYEQIWQEYFRIQPRTDREKTFYTESVDRLNDLGEGRRLRLLSSQTTVPGLMWGLLLVGFVVTIGWSCLFQMSTRTMDIIAVGSLAALTAFVLVLIFALQHPFAGDVAVSPDPYVRVAQQYAAVP